ncbi:MAG: chemotaxis protein CheX [Armatimonadetes bacterium]|nr:chemotaxis protein CheX [Armatimonadota bacterium]
MKVEYVTPFVAGAMSVLEMLLSSKPERGALGARPQIFTTQQINVVCGVTGMIEGQVIYGMSVQTADKIAGLMIGQAITTFDALAASAIAEMGNMISGNSMTQLASTGYTCDITPPTIIRGSNVRILTANIPALVIPITIANIGEIEINVSLQERKARAAA